MPIYSGAFWMPTGSLGPVGHGAEEADEFRLRHVEHPRRLEDHPACADLLGGADELDLALDARLGDRDGEGNLAVDILGRPFHQHAPLGGRQLVDLGRHAEDGDPVHPVGQHGRNLPAHGGSIELPVAAEQRIGHGIDAVEA